MTKEFMNLALTSVARLREGYASQCAGGWGKGERECQDCLFRKSATSTASNQSLCLAFRKRVEASCQATYAAPSFPPSHPT